MFDWNPAQLPSADKNHGNESKVGEYFKNTISRPYFGTGAVKNLNYRENSNLKIQRSAASVAP